MLRRAVIASVLVLVGVGCRGAQAGNRGLSAPCFASVWADKGTRLPLTRGRTRNPSLDGWATLAAGRSLRVAGTDPAGRPTIRVGTRIVVVADLEQATLFATKELRPVRGVRLLPGARLLVTKLVSGGAMVGAAGFPGFRVGCVEAGATPPTAREKAAWTVGGEHNLRTEAYAEVISSGTRMMLPGGLGVRVLEWSPAAPPPAGDDVQGPSYLSVPEGTRARVLVNEDGAEFEAWVDGAALMRDDEGRGGSSEGRPPGNTSTCWKTLAAVLRSGAPLYASLSEVGQTLRTGRRVGTMSAATPVRVVDELASGDGATRMPWRLVGVAGLDPAFEEVVGWVRASDLDGPTCSDAK